VVPREHRRDIWDITPREVTAAIAAARLLAAVMRDDLRAVGANLRHNTGSKAGQDVFHFHLHVIPRYENDTVLPGCVWGVPPWEPPPDGPEVRERVAAVLREGLAGRES
jgi:histidine triad (HIT) family protein